LFQPGRLGKCRGKRPWIGDDDPMPCDAPKGLLLLTRSATNTYFPQLVSVISLPQAMDTLWRRVEEHWSVLTKCESPADVGQARKYNAGADASLEGYSNEDVFARIEGIAAKAGKTDAATDPRFAEFELFACGRRLIGENSAQAHLHAETLDRPTWDPAGAPLLKGIASLVAVHRLREVSCLYGFTRFEPAALASDELEDGGLAVDGAPLGRDPKWLSAVEQFGEGVFLTFNLDALMSWRRKAAPKGRASKLASGVTAWERARKGRGDPRRSRRPR